MPRNNICSLGVGFWGAILCYPQWGVLLDDGQAQMNFSHCVAHLGYLHSLCPRIARIVTQSEIKYNEINVTFARIVSTQNLREKTSACQKIYPLYSAAVTVPVLHGPSSVRTAGFRRPGLASMERSTTSPWQRQESSCPALSRR